MREYCKCELRKGFDAYQPEHHSRNCPVHPNYAKRVDAHIASLKRAKDTHTARIAEIDKELAQVEKTRVLSNG